jgi:hypothetical protein
MDHALAGVDLSCSLRSFGIKTLEWFQLFKVLQCEYDVSRMIFYLEFSKQLYDYPASFAPL